MSKKTEIASEVAEKISNAISGLVFSECMQLYDDLRGLVSKEDKSAQIVLNPKTKVFMDCNGVIDIEVKLEWDTKVHRATDTTVVRIDSNQLDMFEGLDIV